MHRNLFIVCQIVCVVAVGFGAGMFAFGQYLDPSFNTADPASVARFFESHDNRDNHFYASISRGVGIGFITLGALGLLVPWINQFVRWQSVRQTELHPQSPV